MKKPPLQDVIVKSRDTTRRTFHSPGQQQREMVQQRKFNSQEMPVRNDEEFDTERRAHERMDEPPQVRRSAYLTQRTNRRWFYIALGIGAVIVLSSIALSLLFAGATVTVYPKEDTVVVNAVFDAGKDATDTMPIEQIVLEKTAQRAVVALGEENVQERASGKITIYNEYSDTPQRLIKNTRFQSSKNLIYRIRESVEIPGKQSNGTPGSAEVTVFAEKPGDSYNIGPDSFSIPGFVGLPQEDLVYAKSSDSISGGFEGVRRSVNEEERMKTLEQLETQLRDELLAMAFESPDKPEGYHLFKESLFFEFNSLPDEVADSDQVTLSLSGKLHGILFPEDTFAKKIAQLTLSTYKDSPLRIENLDDLSVTLTPVAGEGETDASVVPWQASIFKVSVQGKAHFIWDFDEKSLAQYFAGKNKNILQNPTQNGVLEAYPGIDRLEVSIRPFWKSSFPESAQDIVILKELDG